MSGATRSWKPVGVVISTIAAEAGALGVTSTGTKLARFARWEDPCDLGEGRSPANWRRQ